MPQDWKANRGQKIDMLFAWVGVEADGGEGILGHSIPGLGFVPLIGADKARIESYRSYALQIAEITKKPIRLKQFSTVTVLEQIPEPPTSH